MGAAGALILIAVVSAFLGIAGAGAVLFALIYGGRRAVYALKGEPYRPLLGPGKDAEYKHQDVDAGADESSVRNILRANLQTAGCGKYARQGINALDSADRKTASFEAILGNKFTPTSITYAKFAGASSTTKEGVLRACAELANAIQTFDHADWKRLEQYRRRSAFRSDYRLDDTQIEQYHLLESKLDEMGEIIGRAEKILLELDKLAVELEKLDDAGSSDESERMIEEIRTLADETKYYRKKLDEMDEAAAG